jgi:hypothetical protein
VREAIRRRVVVEPSDVPPTPVQLVSRASGRRNPISARFADAVVAEGRARFRNR